MPAATSTFALTAPMLTVSMLVSMSSICCSGSGGGSSGSGGFFGLAFFVSSDSSFLIRTKSTNLPSYFEVIAPSPVAISICITQSIPNVVNTERNPAAAILFMGSSIPIVSLICCISSDILN